MLKIPKSTIKRHIQRLGLVERLDTWIPHEFKEIHSTKRMNAGDLYFKHNESPPQTTPKAESHQKKIMMSIWWDWKGEVFFELLPRNQTINSDVYCRQLNKLNAAVKELKKHRKKILLPPLDRANIVVLETVKNKTSIFTR